VLVELRQGTFEATAWLQLEALFKIAMLVLSHGYLG
jgi:hypothetical protein